MVSIKGLQKTTAIDYPGKLACTVFISSCNFRCGFCHNPDIVNDVESIESIPESEILAFLDKRKGLLDGVCFTGGEPLLYPGLKGLFSQIKEKGYLIKLDTNGTFPSKVKELIDAKLVDYIAMDIKSDKDHYSLAAGVDVDISKIEESIKLLMESEVNYEFRSTVVPGLFSEEIVENIGKWLKGAKKYYLQQFRNEMPLLDKEFMKMEPFKEKELERFKVVLKEYVDDVEVRS